MALLGCMEEDGTMGASWGHGWVRRKGIPLLVWTPGGESLSS